MLMLLETGPAPQEDLVGGIWPYDLARLVLHYRHHDPTNIDAASAGKYRLHDTKRVINFFDPGGVLLAK